MYFMQAIMESIFDIAYLVTAVAFGILILRRDCGRYPVRLFGIMTLVLGGGDAFHLVPRIYALNTDGVANHAAALGFGTLVTSITMTVFYVMLYHVWSMYGRSETNTPIAVSVYILAGARIVLCLLPQNDWLSADAPYEWGIYRNIPFLMLGLLVLLLFFKEHGNKNFRFMWLAILLSFGFYVPVVLFADTLPIIGMLMLPKTCAYVWMMVMGYKESKPLDLGTGVMQ
jgi:hypothetical protein